MKKSIGIDLGTTNSVVSFKDTEVKILRSKENEELTRSCVSLINSEIFVGKTAYSTGLKKDPINTILSIKRLMGGAIRDKMVQEMISNKKYYKYSIAELKGGTQDAVAVVLGGKQYTPEQISAEILKKLKADAEERLGDEVTHAVITVPAYFTEKQKNATRLAAQMAGFKVQKLLAEPTAAAIAYGVDNLKTGEAKTVLIYDFGGGTYDLSILNIVDGQYMEAGTGGDRWLGGDDIDRKLQEIVVKKVEEQYKLSSLEACIEALPANKKHKFEAEFRIQAEQAKIQLSSTSTANILIDNLLEDDNGDTIDIDVTITRKEFENSIKPFVQRTIDLIEQLLNEVGYDITMIDSILLVGGSSCIPLVKNMLIDKYGVEKIKVSEKPMLAVAEGAGILAHRLGDEYEAPIDSVATIGDISYSANHSYFIELQSEDGSTKLEKIIEKQMPLPITISRVFRTTVENQKIVQVLIHADVENGETEKQTQGYFTISKNLPNRSELVFNIFLDIDETFKISAYPKLNKNEEKSIVLGRGKKDSKALEFINERLKKISEDNYSSNQQEYFYKSIQKEIEKANELGTENPDSDVWSSIGTNVYTAFEQAENMKDNVDEDEFVLVFAQILCNEYPSLIDQDDLMKMKALINKIKTSSDTFEKLQDVSELKNLTEEYTLLITLFSLKIAAGNAEKINPADANKLNQMHDAVISLIKSRKRDEAFALLDEAIELREKYFKGDFSVGIGISK